MMNWKARLATLAATLLLAAPAAGQIVPIGPFSGTFFDNFNNIGQGGAGGHSQVEVFQGFCTVRNATQGGSIKIESSSQLGNDLVTPRSPQTMLGQIGISEWTFDLPVFRWGGYWENNSRFDDANVQFFANGVLIGTMVADDKKAAQAWTWNGWESSIPFNQVRVIGNDVEFLNGFIWWEDFNVTVAAAVPEPSTYALFGLTGALGGAAYYLRRRRASRSPDLV